MKKFSSQKNCELQNFDWMTRLSERELAYLQSFIAANASLFFLDLCVISAIKVELQGRTEDPRKALLIENLKNLDNENNHFSLIIAFTERVSKIRGSSSQKELEDQLVQDYKNVKEFFVKSQLVEDENYIRDFINELFHHPIEKGRESKLNFLKHLSLEFRLFNPVSAKNQFNVAKQVIDYATNIKLSPVDPLVMISLACIYGNTDASDLLKFKSTDKKFDAENALADVSSITRFARRKLMLESEELYQFVGFITDDSGLGSIFQCFKARKMEDTDSEDGGLNTKFFFDVEIKTLFKTLKASQRSDEISKLGQYLRDSINS